MALDILRGPRGLKGDVPAHEVLEGQVRFQNPDGSWGPYFDFSTGTAEAAALAAGLSATAAEGFAMAAQASAAITEAAANGIYSFTLGHSTYFGNSVEEAEIPSQILFIRVSGLDEPGDGYGATYVRVSSQPSLQQDSLRSLDRYLPNGSTDASNGGWWERRVEGLYEPLNGGPQTPARFKLAAFVDLVVDFEAEGDGSDEYANIDAALDEQRSIHVSGADGRVFHTSSPLRMRDGSTLIGESSRTSLFRTHPTFSGDSFLRGFSRDDDAPSHYEHVNIERIGLIQKLNAPIVGLDITGFRNSNFRDLFFDGPGVLIAGATAMRWSDQSPDGTSDKSTFFNDFCGISLSGAGWQKFIQYENHAGNCNTIEMRAFSSYSAIGFFGGTQVNSAGLLLTTGYMLGNSVANAGANKMWAGVEPVGLLTLNVTGEGYGDGYGFIPTSKSIFFGGSLQGRLTGSIDAESLFGPTSGTSAASPISVGQGTPSHFVGSAYVKIPNGTVLAAGITTKQWFFSNPTPAPASFRIAVISGLPAEPLMFQGSLSGITFSLAIASQDGLTLAADLVLKVTAGYDYT